MGSYVCCYGLLYLILIVHFIEWLGGAYARCKTRHRTTSFDNTEYDYSTQYCKQDVLSKYEYIARNTCEKIINGDKRCFYF